MSDSLHNAEGGSVGLTRREAVLAAVAVAAQATLFGWSGVSSAAQAATPSVAAAVGGPVVDTEAMRGFFAFSKAITGHDDIDPLTAARIREALAKSDSSFAHGADVLAQLVQQPGAPIAPEALLAAATDAGLRELALLIVAAWYTGTVGAGTTASVVAYEQALMYRPVADGMSVPTYCDNGPIWWTAEPPPAGVATPKEAARPFPGPPPVSRSH